MQDDFFNDPDFKTNQRMVAHVGARVVDFSLATMAFILSMIFMVLKLCNVVAWSWWLIFLPLIIAVGVPIVIWVVLFIITLIISFLTIKHLTNLSECVIMLS